MPECDMCRSTNMYETTWMTEDGIKLPIDRCNVCGYCNGLKPKNK